MQDAGLRGWAQVHFAGARLSDKRRHQRVITIATALASQPGLSLPQLFATRYELKAAYNLFQHSEATPDNLQAGHRDLVKERLQEPGTYLLPEDTSEFIWTGEPIEGLGMVSSPKGQGFLLHSVLAVRWPGLTRETGKARRPPLDVLGIADQQYYLRKPIPTGEGNNASLARQKRERESQIWEEASRHLGPAPSQARWVRVCDRGADIYEFMRSCQELEHGFVIRAAQDRVLLDGGKLFEHARSAVSLGESELELRSRPGQEARIARLSVAATPVSLRSPARPGAAAGKLPAVECTVVRVWEAHPAPEVEGLEWILLVDRPVTNFEQALECALQYASRWIIEEFHKALKTGLGAERLQLEAASRLFAAIAIMSVVALRLLDLKERLRLFPDDPAEASGFDALELKVLSAYLKRSLCSVRDVALAIGRLGGHMGRKADRMPGLITLWRGLNRLQGMVEGYQLALLSMQG